MQELLPRLLALLVGGKNNRILLLLLEGYLLMAPQEAVFQYIPQLAIAVQRSVETAFNALTLAAALRKAHPDDGASSEPSGSLCSFPHCCYFPNHFLVVSVMFLSYAHRLLPTALVPPLEESFASLQI